MRQNHYRLLNLVSLFVLIAALLAPSGAGASVTPVDRAQGPASDVTTGASAASATTTATLIPTDDATTASANPALNAGSGPLVLAAPNSHHSFIRFDLSVLPANATIDAAELQLNIVQVNGGPRDIEIGRADADWDEGTITWATRPGATWSGFSETASAPGVVTWNVKPLV